MPKLITIALADYHISTKTPLAVFCVPCLDANECVDDPTPCGDGGTCQNIDNGNFYSCDCSNGFEGNGANASDGSLTCVGMFRSNCAHVYLYCF